jgi:hypothetical protein
MKKHSQLVKEVYPYILDFDRYVIGTDKESHKVLADDHGIDDHRSLQHGVITVDHVNRTTQATFYTWSSPTVDSVLQEKAHNAIRKRYGYTSYQKI